MVGRKLQQDFEKSGVLLQGAAERARMQELMNLNNHYPAQYNMALVRGQPVHGVLLMDLALRCCFVVHCKCCMVRQ